MSFFDSMSVSSTGLTAQRLRMDVISQNIANVDTTRTESGGAYKRKTVAFEEILGNYSPNGINSVKVGKNKKGKADKSVFGGVRVKKIIEDGSQGALVYEPNHPDANADGYLEKPNVNIVTEMVNMISATRTYEANITSMSTTKSMVAKTLEIGRG